MIRVTTWGLPDGEFEAFAAHELHQDRELELPATLYLPGVRTARRKHSQGHVADEFRVKPILDQAGGQLGALIARRAVTC